MEIVKKGSKGQAVKTLQTKLGITTDGIYGNDTYKAVIAYQKQHGLTPDGVVGPRTWEALGFASTTPRFIDEIIVHCSATKEGKAITSAQISAMHKARKFSSYVRNGKTEYVGYHFLVHLDGKVEACRPLSKAGCHASGHNTRSIGICYIGGLDKHDTNGKMIKDTRTPEQKAALIQLIKELLAKYPTIKKVMGHRDTSPDLNGDGIISPFEFIKGCPCFDAITEYKSLLK